MKSLNEIVIYVDMDDVLCDFSGAYIASKKTNPDVKFQHSLPGFFENLEPKENAIKVFKWLSEHFNVYILTAPSIYNPLNYTEKANWVKKHLGFDTLYKFIISPNKGMLRGDYLIDDITQGKGQEQFKGKLLHFGAKIGNSDKIMDWKSIMAYFKQIKGCQEAIDWRKNREKEINKI